MADADRSSILDTLGEEIVRIITPVSACMSIVVLLVTALSSSPSSPPPLATIAAIAYPDSSSSSAPSIWDNIRSALLDSLVFVVATTLLTFLLVLLFYFRCTRFLKSYMAFSSLLVLALLGGEVSLLLISRFYLPLDAPTFLILLLNFSILGVLSVFAPSHTPIFLTQCYLVLIGVLVAYWFTLLPEWTTWALLLAMAVYDIAAVLLPGGPLRLLVELAISRDEDIPALVYEARPVDYRPAPSAPLWRASESAAAAALWTAPTAAAASNARDVPALPETRLVIASDITTPLMEIDTLVAMQEEDGLDGIGLGSSGAIKLGLGDFIFYSVLVGRAAMYDFMTVYACYLAIIAGLGVTLMLLAVYRKALPALPVSVALGVLFYFLTRVFLEAFVVQCSANLVMF